MEQVLANWQLGSAEVPSEDIINVPYGKKADPQKLAVRYRGEPVSMRLHIFARDQAEIHGLVQYSMKEIEAKTAKRFTCSSV